MIKKIILETFQSLLLTLQGSKYACPFCNHSHNKFLPTGFSYNILKEKKIIGGGYRNNAICPFCKSSDRERLVYLFLKSNDLLKLKPKMKLLHIAPEINLKNIIEKKNIKYHSADLHNPLAKIKMDIQNIGFPKNHFDAIICNHVLEHIIDDKKAMSELYRVLKPKGWAILQVPYSPIMKHSFEDLSITNSEERAEIFGQSDHVRIYGLDYPTRLKSVGFSVKKKKIDINLIKKFALNPNEIIFFCKK
ncbi:class I SAM-dependent methyltransferase [Candidatus Woesearchaeota archaeon]|jgi:SAM-dependent methyltransferase|nr:class I SAM-dependent methyltransferase [Candidatus Woesearchaeota archaeon]MBT4595756.1 class I SAM-dependent methyltransferase [Candidatus Woesearchaeota archaeon]MBT5741395.1 class I SAM-dependent methyltransferase [Candidatus Woesearchaeota archaeon]MBT6505217.1 class I SAM-dependent methyltransferase [Candidatus Woesearchaeota archaeon]MBT7296099.1 class I SAM-dependent methyltransferase [Candidatus Woesearchaeota archaeon]